MKITAIIGLLLGMIAGNVFAQKNPAVDLLKFKFPATNLPATNRLPTPSRVVVEMVPIKPVNLVSNPVPLLPLIEFSEVPIVTGIENLARQAGINYLLSADLFTDDDGNPAGEPEVSCKWKDITARDALTRICDEHQLSLRENPYTHIVRIVRAGQSRNFINGRLLGLSTNQPAPAVKEKHQDIPLIQFSEVPLDIALMNLIRQAGRSIELSSNLMYNVGQRIDGQGRVTFYDRIVHQNGERRDQWFQPMPELNARWEDISAEAAIVAVCENYDLEIVTDAETGNLLIASRKIRRHHRVGR